MAILETQRRVPQWKCNLLIMNIMTILEPTWHAGCLYRWRNRFQISNPLNLHTMKKLILSLAALAFTGATANAVPVLLDTTSYQGHNYYLYADYGVSWTNAEAHAETLGGTLAVLSTYPELHAVYNALIGNGFFQPGGGSQAAEAWLGARPANGGSSTSDPNNWAWVTGEAWTMGGNFASGEPNGDSSGLAINRFGTFTFNDESGSVGGYIVEVPEGGSALAFLGLGLCTIGLFRNKLSRKKA